jgi:hypothetical protein
MTKAQDTEFAMGFNAVSKSFLNGVLTDRRVLTVGFVQTLVMAIK